MRTFAAALFASCAMAYQTLGGSRVSSFRLSRSNSVHNLNDATYTKVDFQADLSTEAGEENRWASHYLMGEATAADATPDATTYTWYYGEDMARDAPAPVVNIKEVDNWRGQCDYEAVGDNTILVTTFTGVALATKGAAAIESDAAYGIDDYANGDEARWRSIANKDLTDDRTWSTHLIAEIVLERLSDDTPEVIACGEFRRTTQRTVARYLKRVFIRKGLLTCGDGAISIINPALCTPAP